MAAGLLFVVPLFGLLLVGVVVLVVLAATHSPDAALPHEVASARRHGVVVSVVATTVLLLGAVVLTGMTARSLQGTPVLAAAVPLLAAAGALVVLLVGELTWPRPKGATRTAVLSDRRVRDLARGGWAVTALLVSGGLALVVVVGAVLADGSGRTITTTSVGNRVSATAGPFPGVVYGGPQLAALVIAVALVALVLWAATNRAAVVTADPATDALLRRSSAARAFRILTFAVLLTLAADLFYGGSAAQRVHDGAFASAVAVAATLAGLLCGVLSLVALLFPVPRLTRSALPQHPVRV
ncbi:hypothetical protein [Nocardioides iriomotensis]|uniref:Uncharacterized protein n=1 Tax=Nocardioides iriomotensis TaxID=715784 RepID=A0A4Q5ISY9_9ACTN|nr:hypothetical protein [Nocardioides iriomotensis]RYU08773.1 hypothetical protein ETU37_22765 [Nocardioides iriomotensis]